MPISLTITGTSLADIQRQCAQIAAEGTHGVETVPGRVLEVHAEANTRSPVDPSPMADAPAAPKPPPSIDDVRKAVAEAVKAKGREGVEAVLAKFGAKKIPDLDAPKYAEVIAALAA